jgi:hypothetical protein
VNHLDGRIVARLKLVDGLGDLCHPVIVTHQAPAHAELTVPKLEVLLHIPMIRIQKHRIERSILNLHDVEAALADPRVTVPPRRELIRNERDHLVKM